MTAPSEARLAIAVGAGAGVGALARHLVSLAIVGLAGQSALWATGGVNVAGSFGIALFAVVTGAGGRFPLGPAMRLGVMTGLFGGFTTFSLLSLDVLLLLLTGRMAGAALYLAATLSLSILAAWAGYLAGRRVNQTGLVNTS